MAETLQAVKGMNDILPPESARWYPGGGLYRSVWLSKTAPVELPAYPYPIFMAYGSQPADVVHAVTKSMIVNYADYKDGAPGADGLELKRQNLTWVLPYHAGAVRALKEAGVWTPQAQQHNDQFKTLLIEKSAPSNTESNATSAAAAARAAETSPSAPRSSTDGFDTSARDAMRNRDRGVR